MLQKPPVKSKLHLVLGFLVVALAASAQPSTITYQGQLITSGDPANGPYNLRFALFDAATLGNPVGTALTNTPVPVTNGQFSVTLDFGSGVFDGNPRWLEIGVRPHGSGAAYTILNPRQLITATPYAIRAANYSGPLVATNLTGKIADTNLSANVPLLTNHATFTRSVTASNFIGSGLELTNLSTTNLIGILPDARLSPNVALRNTSNVFLGPIIAPQFTGDGVGLTNVPGRIFEVIPTATNIQAVANFGYLATNNATAVIVTLPPTANIRPGETIRVSGSGAAGWIIAQNTNQTILVANLLNTVGVNWISNGGAFAWNAIASSADGSRLVAVVNSGGLYTSGNYGLTWSPQANAGNRAWSCVAMSADGLKIIAGVNSGFLYTSTDGGSNWTARFNNANRAWTGVASSWDGTRLVGVAATGGFVSVDSGVTWNSVLGAASYSAVACSGNGSNIVATVQGGTIGISTNGGATWSPRESNRSWTSVASSADGGTLVASVNSGANYVYVSTDYGASWVPGNIGANWSGVACSADGSRMIAVANLGGVYVSNDSGVTWLQRGNLPISVTYNGAACSGDGTTLAAVAAANPIFVSSKTSTTSGITGSLSGSRLAAVELQHVGNGVFIPISYVGTIRAK